MILDVLMIRDTSKLHGRPDVRTLYSFFELWKKCLGRFTGRSPHGSSATFTFSIVTAKLTLLSTTATALAVKAACDRFLLGILADLGRVHRVIMVITAAGDPLRILTAQLTLLSTTTLAAGLHACLHTLFPNTLEAFSTIEPTARVLGFQFLLGILAHLWGIHRMPVIVAARIDALGVFTAQLALLTTTATAAGLHARLHILLPGTLEAFSTV